MNRKHEKKLNQNKKHYLQKLNSILNQADRNAYEAQAMSHIKAGLPKQSKKQSRWHDSFSNFYESNHNKSNYLNGSIILTLLKLWHKKSQSVRYYPKYANIRSNQINRSRFAIFHTLLSLNMVKVLRVTHHHSYNNIKYSLSSLGQTFVNQFLKKYLHHRYWNIIRVPIILSWIFMIAFSAIIIWLCLLGRPFTILFSSIVLAFIYEIILVKLIRHSKKIIKKLLKQSNITLPRFRKFLSQHHVREPNINYQYDNNLPKISNSLF